MDKSAIKKYAVWARTELITRVSQRAEKYDITAEADASASSVNGVLLSDAEIKQRKALIEQVKQKGFDQVMEEVAYTWFNRFIALRFMEVNGYLPSHIRVFTDDNNNFKPQILAEAIHLELDGLDMEKVYEMKNNNENDELYKYLIITQCNDLSKVLPRMFQKISDYTELMFPDNILREGSVIEQMIVGIPENDWTDQVQIIGWLYQYYNTEPKEKVFSELKKNIKISSENIPAATQLFTPDWIVHYMVENSLGRMWLDGHPNDGLKASWEYYIDDSEQDAEVEAKLLEIKKELATLTPEDIRVIDPCQGSGHILCVIFDTLIKIYEDYGYTTREATASIIENNIWGLDIDERASQLAYFSVMMKACQYDRRFLTRKIQPHVYAINDSNRIDVNCIEYFSDGRADLRNAIDILIDVFKDAKNFGSLIRVSDVNFKDLYQRIDEIRNETNPTTSSLLVMESFPEFIQVAEALAQKYHVVVTNPPYMGSAGMGKDLFNYIKKNYPDSKSDLFAVFIEKCIEMADNQRYISMITQHSWMFLSDYKKLRAKTMLTDTVNMIHLGSRAFDEIGGEVVQTTAFVLQKCCINKYNGVYCRLLEPSSEQGKKEMFLSKKNRFVSNQLNFDKIPGSPIAYWVSHRVLDLFEKCKSLDQYAQPRQGMATCNNDKYLRMWYEPSIDKIGFGFHSNKEAVESGKKWFPYHKGGGYRKWYGNLFYVVNWENDGEEIKQLVVKKYPYLKGNYEFVLKTTNPYFSESITWSDISTSDFACRYSPNGFMYDVKGTSMAPDNNILYYFIGLLNSRFIADCLKILNPTMSYQVGNIKSLPVILDETRHEEINELVKEAIAISKKDWDAFETSWEFKKHPLIIDTNRISFAYEQFEKEMESNFKRLHEIELKLNQIFIEIYKLEDELVPYVNEENVTVRKADLQREIRSFISYAVGCMFGRYSIDATGLCFAGNNWDDTCYISFIPDKDGIIPICDDEYFEDDITGLFIRFVEQVYGKETLEENLKFIADALGGNGSPREVIRGYFLNDFYADHLKVYQKRPIYWLFDSGKKNGFKCLIYLHRYQPDTIARIRTDYVHEQQARYRTAIEETETRLLSVEGSEKVKLNKKIKKLKDQNSEIHAYEEKIHHLADQMIPLDLDDGVKDNYAKFQEVLAKIK